MIDKMEYAIQGVEFSKMTKLNTATRKAMPAADVIVV